MSPIKDLAIFLLVGQLQSFAAKFRAKDADDEGIDDFVANTLDEAATKIQQYQASPKKPAKK